MVAAVRKFDLSSPARRVAIGLPPYEPRGFWKNLPSNEKLLAGIAIFFAGIIVGMAVGIVMPKPEAKATDTKDDAPPVRQEQHLDRMQ